MSYADFKNGLQSFNEYVSAENQSIDLAGDYDNAVVRVELGSSAKQMICDLLAGKGLRLPQIQFCLDVNLSILQGLAAGVHIGLASALGACREGLNAFNEHTGLTNTLGRLNMIIGEAASVASMINVCNSPINPVPIPNLIETIMGSFLGKGEAILNKLGRLVPGRLNVCYDPATGKIGHDAYLAAGLLEEIRQALEAGFDITGIVDEWIAQLNSIRDDFAYIISIENDAATAAVEAQGLGKTVDTVTTLADNAPLVSIRSPLKDESRSPAKVAKVNKYKDQNGNTITGTTPNGTYNETTYGLEIAVKFTEKMDPATITGRSTSDTTNINDGYYGTIAILAGGEELKFSIGPIRVDENYTTFKGIVQVPENLVPTEGNTTPAILYVGSNTRSGNNLVIPTSESGKVMPSTDWKSTDFAIGPSVDAVAAVDVVGFTLPGDMILGLPEYTSINEPMADVVNLFSITKDITGYPVQTTDGTILSNVLNGLPFDEATVNSLLAGEGYLAPVYTTVPEYDYCGNIIGYKTEFTQGVLEGDTPSTTAALGTNLLIPPKVARINPSSDAVNVKLDISIIVTFTQEMDASSFTTGDVRTTWKPTTTYNINDPVEYLGVHYTSTTNNNVRNAPLGSSSWTQTSAAQTGAGTGTVRFKQGSTYLTGFTLTYNSGSKQLVITPSSLLAAGSTYNIEIIGTNTSSAAGVSPVENTSGVPMANTFSSSFTASATGETESSGVVVSASGGTVGLPSYTVTELLLLSVTSADAGSMAWCSNDYSSGSIQSTTAVYNGSNWVRVDNGAQITAPP